MWENNSSKYYNAQSEKIAIPRIPNSHNSAAESDLFKCNHNTISGGYQR